ncbi:MAG: glycosyltransferase [Clostridiales bacterium]|jgi:glycosyltransferase involved in cell wall biosynthesis|nr:glycosyltransferase [Clostridiales bacterium]
MQGKVSMVITCYNKEEYIGDMFNTVISQEWDNLEVIIVNDGSTDGTRGIITDYVTKLEKRGYLNKVIDIENSGICTAAKKGLECATGDYICIIDADDELDTQYVSKMAEWLDNNSDYDYVVCDKRAYIISGKDKIFNDITQRVQMEFFSTEWILFTSSALTVWRYMVRSSYFRKCKVIENYNTSNRWSHEPGFIIPITAYNGKVKYINMPLYYVNDGCDGMSKVRNDAERAFKYYNNYRILCYSAIDLLPDEAADKKRKTILKNLTDYFRANTLLSFDDIRSDNEVAEKLDKERQEAAKNMLFPYKQFLSEHEKGVMHYFVNNAKEALANKPNKFRKPVGRVIGCGAKGQDAKKLLPFLKGTCFEPCMLWDRRVTGNDEKLFGISFEKQNFKEVLDTDTLIVFPEKANIQDEFRAELLNINSFQVLFSQDMHDLKIYLAFDSMLEGGNLNE